MSDGTVELVDYAEEGARIRAVRSAVFVCEQGVPEELEVDGRDATARHVLALVGGQAVGTGRLLADGHIGRVAVLREFRGRGLGRMIMVRLLAEARALGLAEVWLDSQCHAVEFYCGLGFVAHGAPFREAGIDHVRMRRRL